jgi:hypothetical protein
VRLRGCRSGGGAQITPRLDSALQRDVKVHNLDLVLDERPAGFAVLAADVGVSEINTVAFLQKAYTVGGERIDIRRRAGGRIKIELGAGAIDVAGMEQALQAFVGTAERAADQGGDVG